MKKTVLNLIIICAMFLALIILVFFTSSIDQLSHLFSNIKYEWIAAALACMVVFWIGEAVVLHITTTFLVEKHRFIDSLKAAMIGTFFNSVTPFSSGGQPAQIYVMVKDGIKTGHAASVIVIKSVTYQAVILLYSLFVLIVNGRFFMKSVPGFFYLYIIGFLLNLLVIVTFFIFIYNRVLGHKMVLSVFNFIKKLKILSKLAKFEPKLEKELETYSESAILLNNNKSVMISTFIIQFIRLTFFYAIPYFIYIAMESINKVSIWNMIAAQSVVTMIASYVPLPGSSGGAEGTGYLFFSLYFKAGTIVPMLFIWRLITYYSSIVAGGLVSVIVPEKPLKEKELYYKGSKI